MNTNKKGIILIILTIFCFVLILFFITKLLVNKDHSGEKEQRIKLHLIELENNLRISIKNDEIYLPDTLKLLDMKGNSLSIKDLASKHSVVYRYTSSNCGTCVSKDFNSIKQVLGKIKHPELFCFIVTGYARRDVLLTFKSLEIDCAVYFLAQTDIGITIDNYSLPYYFRLNPDLRISNVFVPVTWNHGLSEFYLQTMLAEK
jgi:hypothetical protein